MELKFSLLPFDCGCHGSSSSGSGDGTSVSLRQPKTFIVGTTAGAPTAGDTVWTNADFADNYVVLVLNRSTIIDMTDAGDSGAYVSKLPASTQLTINNYLWQTGDVLSYILIPA